MKAIYLYVPLGVDEYMLYTLYVEWMQEDDLSLFVHLGVEEYMLYTLYVEWMQEDDLSLFVPLGAGREGQECHKFDHFSAGPTKRTNIQPSELKSWNQMFWEDF